MRNRALSRILRPFPAALLASTLLVGCSVPGNEDEGKVSVEKAEEALQGVGRSVSESTATELPIQLDDPSGRISGGMAAGISAIGGDWVARQAAERGQCLVYYNVFWYPHLNMVWIENC